jgi:hypothetical protein
VTPNNFFLIPLVFLFSACGKDVSINQSKLESFSHITDSSQQYVTQDARLIRLNGQSTIAIAAKSYQVSKYSSEQALSFIAARAPSSETNIVIKGEIKASEIKIVQIQLK